MDQKFLIVSSGACILIGTTLLASAIEFQADKLADDDSILAKAVKDKGSPGRINRFRYKAGMFLNALGYVLLLIGTYI